MVFTGPKARKSYNSFRHLKSRPTEKEKKSESKKAEEVEILGESRSGR